jgi:hypothetical protein
MSSAYGEVASPDTGANPNQESTLAAAEQKKDEQIHEYADARLKSLVKSDDMYYALEYFLLGDPERQIPQLGDTATLLTKGDEAKARDDDIIARTQYETAAKIEIYKGGIDSARRCLLKAQEVTPEDNKRFQLMTTLLDHTDEAIGIARSYYEILAKETSASTAA